MVLKAYLAKAAEWKSPAQPKWDENPDRIIAPLRNLLAIYGDREIAENIVEVMIKYTGTINEEMLLELSPYFTIESTKILKTGLISNDERLRAWCVWQLRKVGYQFSEEELSKLLVDKSWKVRANTVAAGGAKAIEGVAYDPNLFVRWVAILAAEQKQ
jgi:HEAT repeat protein